MGFTKHRKVIEPLILLGVLAVSLLANIVQFANRDELNAGQIKQIAYGRSLQHCLRDSSLTKADCADAKLTDLDKPEQTYGGEAWVVGSYCFDLTGVELDCTTYKPISN
jgi:hypothetical protein